MINFTSCFHLEGREKTIILLLNFYLLVISATGVAIEPINLIPDWDTWVLVGFVVFHIIIEVILKVILKINGNIDGKRQAACNYNK